MQPVMSVSAVRELEGALAEKGIKAQELMRRAGAVVAYQAARLVDQGGVVVLCGMGNNGGDGWVAADNLARHGYEVNVVCAAPVAVMKTDPARHMASRVAEMGIPVYVDPSYDKLASLLVHADVVIDAVFGTGLAGALPSPYDEWVRAVDDVFTGALVAVDVPSGINATTGMSDGPYFEADVTVTMFAAKPGLISGEGRRAAGTVVVAGLVTEEEGLVDVSDVATAFTLTDRDYCDALPAVDPLRDKYTRGRVTVVAGSSRYPGAAIMAAKAAARAGAGYVTLVVPEPVVSIAQTHLLSVPVVGLPADADGSFAASAADRIPALVAKADAVLAGPGLTTSFGASEVVRQLLECPVALVLDADGLNAAVKMCTGSAEEHPAPLRREHPLILTPHRRELARLAGVDASATASLAQAVDAAQSIAWAVGSGNFCVLSKGPVSAVTAIEGTLIPEPGPAALATAGSGDVLGGVVAGILSRAVAMLEPGEDIDSGNLLLLMAAADRVHAVAGHLAEERYGSCGVVAPDLVDLIGIAQDGLVEAAERADEECDEEGAEKALVFEDESRITPPPEVERLIRSDAAARAVELPGEVKAYEGELEEPDSVAARRPAPQKEDEGLAEDGGQPASDTPVAEDAPDVQEGPAAEEGAVLQALTGESPVLDGASQDSAEESVLERGAAPSAPVVPDFLKAQVAPAADPDATRVMRPVAVAETPVAPVVEDASPVPPFLARAVEAAKTSVAASDGDAAVASADETRQFSPEELERQRIAEFHERATLRIADDSVTPVDERPRARPKVRRHK